MAKGIGRLVQVGLAKETNRGTAASNASYWISHSELAVDEKRDFIQDNTARGFIADTAGAEISKAYVEGNIKAPVADKHFGLVLLSTFGQLSTSGPSDSAYTHNFNVLNSGTHPSLTVFFSDPVGGQDYKFALGVISSLELTAELGKYFEYNANFLAKPGVAATLNPATASETFFRPKDICIKIADTIANAQNATPRKVESFSLSISKNIEEDQAFCENAEPKDFIAKSFTVEGELTAVWENETDYMNDYKAGNSRAIVLSVENIDVVIGIATHPKFEVELPKVTFTELTRNFGVDEVIKQTVSFKAHFDLATGKQISAKLINTISSY